MAIFEGLLWNIISITTALLAIGYVYLKWSYQYWKRRNIPSLEPTIPFGNFGKLLRRMESFGDWSQRIYNEGKAKGYKYFGIFVISSPVFIVVDLELAKNIMTKDFNNFVDRGVYTNEKDDPLSDHLFATTGKKWRNLRIKLTPTFTSGKMKAMFQTLVDCGLVLEKYIEDHAASEQIINIKDVLGCFSTDIIGSCAFGLDCNSFKEPNNPFRVYGKRVVMQDTIQLILGIFSLSFPKIARALHVRVIPKDVSEFFTKTVEDAVKYREKNNYKRKDFLQLLIDIRNINQGQPDGQKDAGNTLTMDEIAAQSLIFFIAGFETSSTTMTFALYLLAKHPEIQAKLKEEIDTVLEEHKNQITYDSLSEMKYMGQVIDETLRLYPALPALQRIAQDDYKIPGEDTIIEKGTQVFIPIMGFQHDEEYFDNPEVFDPERFSEENKKKIRQYSHMPFGEGPRNCIGERFGIMQSKVGLTSILKNFQVTLNEKTKEPLKFSPTSGLLSVEGDIWLNFERL